MQTDHLRLSLVSELRHGILLVYYDALHDASCAITPWKQHENLWFSPAVPWNAVSAWEEREYYVQKSKKLFLRLTWKFQGGSSSVQWACWGQALRMNLKQPRASWDTEDALTAPCCRLNFTALCFADLHFGLKISLVLFYFFGPTHENHFVRLPSAVLFLLHI